MGNAVLRQRLRRLQRELNITDCPECQKLGKPPFLRRVEVTFEEYIRQEEEYREWRARTPPSQDPRPGVCSSCGKQWPIKLVFTTVLMPDGRKKDAASLRWLLEHPEHAKEHDPYSATWEKEAEPLEQSSAQPPDEQTEAEPEEDGEAHEHEAPPTEHMPGLGAACNCDRCQDYRANGKRYEREMVQRLNKGRGL